MIKNGKTIYLLHEETHAIPFINLMIAYCATADVENDQHGVSLLFETEADAKEVFDELDDVMNENDKDEDSE